jgi:hypothetical protein
MPIKCSIDPMDADALCGPDRVPSASLSITGGSGTGCHTSTSGLVGTYPVVITALEANKGKAGHLAASISGCWARRPASVHSVPPTYASMRCIGGHRVCGPQRGRPLIRRRGLGHATTTRRWRGGHSCRDTPKPLLLFCTRAYAVLPGERLCVYCVVGRHSSTYPS